MTIRVFNVRNLSRRAVKAVAGGAVVPGLDSDA
jgi:hypothetical protein